MKLIKTTIFSGVITIVKIASGFVASKIVAMVAGASGVAILGAFTNFITIALTFANGAINTGVIKYTAEFDGDENKLKRLFSTALKISIYCSLFFGIILCIFAKTFSRLILLDEKYFMPIIVFGVVNIFYSLNSLLISILNGKGQIKDYTIVNMFGSLVGLVFTILLVWMYNILGALYALVTAQALVFFITLAYITKSDWFKWSYFSEKFDRDMLGKLGQYSIMTIVAILTVPLAQIVVRNMIISEVGITSAGYWQGMMRISDGYLMIFTTSLSTYYLPKLASLKNDSDIRKEIFKAYKILLPSVILSCIFIYFMRFIIIRILFTTSFNAMENLFFWQLLGDFFKMTSWILGYLMLAKAMTKQYIIIEILISLSYILLSYICVQRWQLLGSTIAFAANYLLSLIVMIIIFGRLLFNKKTTENV
ncbi:MAG: O-antigen translocase [Pedobacter sp.]|nr:MAG: O-antigen translocase [Pedobacter sp.]